MEITEVHLRRIIREALLRESSPVSVDNFELPDDLLNDWVKYDDLINEWLADKDTDLTYDEYFKANSEPGDRSFNDLMKDTMTFMEGIGITSYTGKQKDAFYARLAEELGGSEMFTAEFDSKVMTKNDAILKRRNSSSQKAQDQKSGSTAVRPNVFPDRGPPLELDSEKGGWSVNDPFPDFGQKNR